MENLQQVIVGEKEVRKTTSAPLREMSILQLLHSCSSLLCKIDPKGRRAGQQGAKGTYIIIITHKRAIQKEADGKYFCLLAVQEPAQWNMGLPKRLPVLYTGGQGV